ncbi:18651_t:CDS:2, partial [Rhizophagus irregularis]
DDSCCICHPVLTIPDRYFLRFWNWYSLEIPTLSYSAKTVQYFYEYSQGTVLRQQYLIRKLISSIRYQNASLSYDRLAIKIYTARERFQNFNLDPFVCYQHEDEPLGYELSFITPPTSPILRYPRNFLFINEPLYLEYLFDDENMSNLQNNQGQGQPPNRFNQAPQVNQADIQALTAAVQALTGQMLAPNNLGNAMNTLNATVAANNNALQNRNHNVAQLLNYAGQTTSEITELTKLVAALTEQITEIGKKVTGNRPPPRSDSRNPNVPSGPNRTIVCYTCGEAGHVSRRCPNNAINTSVTNPVIAPVVTTTPPTSATNDTQSLVQELLKQLNSTSVDAKPDKSSISLNTLFEAYPAQRRSQMRRAEPYSRPVVSEEEESSQPLDIPTAPIDIPKTVKPMIVTEMAETSSKAIEQTTVNIAAKKKKAPVVKKKKKMNLQPLISLHVPPYSMVDDIKNQQARITFGQLLEVAPKCHSELIRGIRKPTVRKMNLEEEEEFEDDEPEERVFFTMQFEKPRRPMRIRYRNSKKKAEVRKRDPLPESSVLLDCKFANVVIDAIYPCEDFVLTNEGIYLGKCFHTWGHLQHLNQKFKTTPPKKATWVYDWKGPKAKYDLITYQSVCRLSPTILKELSRERCDDGVVPSEEQ